MKNIESPIMAKIDTPKFLNICYRLNRKDKNKWLEPDEENDSVDGKLGKYLKEISIAKLMQSKNMVIQKKEAVEKKLAVRIAISEKEEERWVGYFKDPIEYCMLLITHKNKPYVELFISETVKNNAFSLLQMLDSGELNNEISFYRKKWLAKAD